MLEEERGKFSQLTQQNLTIALQNAELKASLFQLKSQEEITSKQLKDLAAENEILSLEAGIRDANYQAVSNILEKMKQDGYPVDEYIEAEIPDQWQEGSPVHKYGDKWDKGGFANLPESQASSNESGYIYPTRIKFA